MFAASFVSRSRVLAGGHGRSRGAIGVDAVRVGVVLCRCAVELVGGRRVVFGCVGRCCVVSCPAVTVVSRHRISCCWQESLT